MPDPQHIAYEVSIAQLNAARKRAVQEFLSEVDCYDSDDPDDLDTAIRCIDHAFDLCEQAKKIASQMLQLSNHDKATAELERRRPGFSEMTYRHAIDQAFAATER